MDDGQNDTIVDGRYAQLEHEIDTARIRADRMRDQYTQIRDRSKLLREQADIAHKQAQALISTFRRQGRQQTP